MKATKEKYSLGVIGAGARGEAFARQLFKGHPRATLFGVCDVDGDRLEKFCDWCQLENTPRFTDPAEFFAQPGLDGVIICTPDFTHGDVATAAMEAGKPIYLEKPLANTLENCYRIIDAQRKTGVVAYVGFNLRASAAHEKLRDIVQEGMLGQMVFVSGLEVLHHLHGAAYMRRFHRKQALSGGLLNHKSCHDLDLILWIVGHQHKVVRVSSFGGTNVLTPDKQPAKFCHECPREIYEPCPYKAVPGFHFPIGGGPNYHQGQPDIYGADNCVYDADKDIVDNQVAILEWDNGLRGTFALQMFQNPGRRELTFLGEKGTAELRNGVRVVLSAHGDSIEYAFAKREGGHGGTDPSMIGRFVRAMDTGGAADSGLEQGLAATLVALKADESRLNGGRVTEIGLDLYR
jgi:predicted dehydrogenase